MLFFPFDMGKVILSDKYRISHRFFLITQNNFVLPGLYFIHAYSILRLLGNGLEIYDLAEVIEIQLFHYLAYFLGIVL